MTDADTMQARDNFCIMPWVGMFYRIDQAKVCCGHTFKTAAPADLRDAPEIMQLKKELLANERPDSCKICWHAEDHGMASLRNLYMFHFEGIDRAQYTETSSHDLEYLELRIDNLCNFACRICDQDSSTLIAAELERHPNLKPYLGIRTDQTIAINKQITETNWQQVIDRLGKVKALQLTGGEPMLIKKFYDLMDLLIDNKIADNMLLMITTNCSVVNPQILQRLSQFKKVVIIASIDAVGSVAEYQRYGTDWEVVTKNVLTFLSLPNCDFTINGTLTAYSVLDFANLCRYIADISDLCDHVAVTFNLVSARDHMHPTVLAGELRERAVAQLHQGRDIIRSRTGKAAFGDQIDGMIDTMMTEDNTDKFDRFVQYTRDYDKVRGESFEQIFGAKIY